MPPGLHGAALDVSTGDPRDLVDIRHLARSYPFLAGALQGLSYLTESSR
jgi:hypothetical protein